MTPPRSLATPAQSLCTSGPQEARKAALPVAAGTADGKSGRRAFGDDGGAAPGAGRATATRAMHAGDNSPRWDNRQWMRRPWPGCTPKQSRCKSWPQSIRNLATRCQSTGWVVVALVCGAAVGWPTEGLSVWARTAASISKRIPVTRDQRAIWCIIWIAPPPRRRSCAKLIHSHADCDAEAIPIVPIISSVFRLLTITDCFNS
jgi:hypothetical protein